MPAPEVETSIKNSRPAVGHVNLMVDTLIANATTDDLRAIVRSLLTSSPPTVSASFVAAARGCLGQSLQRGPLKHSVLFEAREEHGHCYMVTTPKLNGLLAYTRSLYGAGMGFDSLDVLSNIIRSTSGIRWDAADALVDIFAVIDADISQAIQSCREELLNGHVRDISKARGILRKLRTALSDCRSETELWGTDFPFSRGSSNADCLQL